MPYLQRTISASTHPLSQCRHRQDHLHAQPLRQPGLPSFLTVQGQHLSFPRRARKLKPRAVSGLVDQGSSVNSKLIFFFLLEQSSLCLSPTHPHSFSSHPDHQTSGPGVGTERERLQSSALGIPGEQQQPPQAVHPHAPFLWLSTVWSCGLRHATPQPPHPEVSRAGLPLLWQVSQGNPLSVHQDDMPQLVLEASTRL